MDVIRLDDLPSRSVCVLFPDSSMMMSCMRLSTLKMPKHQDKPETPLTTTATTLRSIFLHFNFGHFNLGPNLSAHLKKSVQMIMYSWGKQTKEEAFVWS